MPKVNTDFIITNIKGIAYKDSDNLDMTLQWVLVQAILSRNAQEVVDGNESLRRLKLAMRIDRGGEQDFTSEEIVEMKKLIPNLRDTTLVARAILAIEGKMLDADGNQVPIEKKSE